MLRHWSAPKMVESDRLTVVAAPAPAGGWLANGKVRSATARQAARDRDMDIMENRDMAPSFRVHAGASQSDARVREAATSRELRDILSRTENVTATSRGFKRKLRGNDGRRIWTAGRVRPFGEPKGITGRAPSRQSAPGTRCPAAGHGTPRAWRSTSRPLVFHSAFRRNDSDHPMPAM